MRAVYVLIVLGFLRRLLRKVLVPAGKYLWRHGGYVLGLDVGGEEYGIVCFGRQARIDAMLHALIPYVAPSIPSGCRITVRAGMMSKMKTWQEIDDDMARKAASDISDWFEANGEKYL